VLYAGSGGETTRTLESVLHLPKGNNDLPRNPALFEYITPEEEHPELHSNPPIFLVGNAIWYSNRLTLNPTFESNMKKAFSLETFPVTSTTTPRQVAEDMDRWVNRTTGGLIPSISPEHSVKTSFTMLNTLFFKAHWKNKFIKSRTKDAPFTLANGEIISVSTMKEESGFPFMQNEEIKALEMPYFSFLQFKDGDKNITWGGDFSMLFILPRTVDGIPALEEKLSEEFLREIVHSLNPTFLEVSIPKYRLEQENNLQDIFDDDSLVSNADYSGMFTPNPVTEEISAKQKIVLGIDEDGTVAGVATGIGLSVSLPGEPPPIFIVDHPFLFLIRERKSGAILFLGRVMNPNEK